MASLGGGWASLFPPCSPAAKAAGAGAAGFDMADMVAELQSLRATVAQQACTMGEQMLAFEQAPRGHAKGDGAYIGYIIRK